MKDVYTVAAVNQYIKQLIDSEYALNRIYVKGEISNCKYHTSGHIYFTLKDKTAAIACVMFAGSRRGLNFRLAEGMQVIILGSISVYERDGRYQLYAREIIQDGTGLLYQQYELLKQKLLEEGLFDAAHKKRIPAFASKIGIVTAKTGAAIQDIINVTTRRNPYVQLVFYPAKVQGQGAAETVAAGISALDAYGVDVIIAGRGGGSIEDLWAFNEEIVARAIYACQTPVISAVGHETDVTIADFVADLRAPTPSAAAELASADILSILSGLEAQKVRLSAAMARAIAETRMRLKQKEEALRHLSPEGHIRQQRQYLISLEERLRALMEGRLTADRHRLALHIEKLKGLSPMNKLSSGYAFISDGHGKMVKSVDHVLKGERLNIAMADGEIEAEVIETHRQHRR